jgi:hypothetical protein
MNMINTETRILLYLFGFILLLTSNWEQFFTNSKIKVLKDFTQVLGLEGSR